MLALCGSAWRQKKKIEPDTRGVRLKGRLQPAGFLLEEHSKEEREDQQCAKNSEDQQQDEVAALTFEIATYRRRETDPRSNPPILLLRTSDSECVENCEGAEN